MSAATHITLVLGQVPIELVLHDRALADAAVGRYAAFRGTAEGCAGPRSVLEFRLGAEPEPALPPSAPRVGRAGMDVSVVRAPDGGLTLARPGWFHGVLDPWRVRGSFTLVPRTPHGDRADGALAMGALDCVARIVFSLVLPDYAGTILHSAGVVVAGRAYVFTGVSGAGKSTISSLAPAGAELLSDDLVVLRRVGDALIASGTPFSGQMWAHARAVSAPVASLLHLRQAPENALRRLSEAEAVRRLLRNLVNFDPEPRAARHMLDLAAALARDAWELHFTPTREAWAVVLRGGP